MLYSLTCSNLSEVRLHTWLQPTETKKGVNLVLMEWKSKWALSAFWYNKIIILILIYLSLNVHFIYSQKLNNQ